MSKNRKAKEPDAIVATVPDLFKATNDASPMVCAVVCAAYIEQALMSVLKKALIKSTTTDDLFSGGTLGDISACNKIAYCLGLIPKGISEVRP